MTTFSSNVPKPLYRTAIHTDLLQIVGLLAEDDLGRAREDCCTPLPAAYNRAFDAIEQDANNELLVAASADQIIAVLQCTYTPLMLHQGSWRATLEGVRVAAAYRGKGIGSAFLRWVIARAQARGCALVQLTTDKRRIRAQHFYSKLGFVASHEGMKYSL